MDKTLKNIVNTIDFDSTDIALQRQYQRLNILHDKMEECKDLFDNLETQLDLNCLNGEIRMIMKKRKTIDYDKMYALFEDMIDRISNEAALTAFKSQELYTFQKLGNALTIYKQL